jgi:multicomponent Na+:H+ antiporter subunit E
VTVLAVVLLVALWILAWGKLTLANVLSGVLVAAVLFAVFPSTRRTFARPPRPVATARLVLYVLGQMVVSNVLVAREILSRQSRIRTGVIAHRMRDPSREVITVLANIVALTPGTMTVDVTEEPPVVYLHFLLLDDVDEARRSAARLEDLVIAAIGRPEHRTEEGAS